MQQKISELHSQLNNIREAIAQVIVGQQELIEKGRMLHSASALNTKRRIR